MKHPVVLLSDGHNPCYEYDVLNLLHLKNKWLFLMPQNTTGKTWLLDQLNVKPSLSMKTMNTKITKTISSLKYKL